MAASSVCGGSLVKGNQGAASIAGMLQRGIGTTRFESIPADRPVCCRAVPGHQSVLGRGVADAEPPIMESAGARYGGRRKAVRPGECKGEER